MVNISNSFVQDNVKYTLSEKDGKYVVGQAVTNGNMGAGMSFFDSAEEANAYLASKGIDESLFFDEPSGPVKNPGIIDPFANIPHITFGPRRNPGIFDPTRIILPGHGHRPGYLPNPYGTHPYPVTPLEEFIRRAIENYKKHHDELSPMEKAGTIGTDIGNKEDFGLTNESPYTRMMGQFGRMLSQYSLLNWLTGGKYADAAENAFSQVSRYSGMNVAYNLGKEVL